MTELSRIDRLTEPLSPPAVEHGRWRRRPHILIVDDNPEMLLALNPLLTARGYRVSEALTGQECLRLARTEHPDLILLDVVLPDIQGLEICRDIKAEPSLRDIFVVLISGQVNGAEDRIKGLNHGADEYIPRPIIMQELLARLDAMVRIKETIRARRVAEQQVLQLNQTLERRVAERTSQLEQINHALTSEIAERKRVEQRLGVEYAVSRILVESVTVGEALHKILGTTCELLRWDRGELWIFNPRSNEMRCGETWHVGDKEFPAFDAVTRLKRFVPGQSLPGTVWATRQPRVIADVTVASDFERAAAAAQDGLRGALAFPVQAGKEVLAAMVFFSRETRSAESELIQMFTSIGEQIGLFITRKKTEEALRESEKRFRVMADEAPVMIWMSDSEKRCTFFNRVWLEFRGRTMEQEHGDGWAEGVHADDLSRCLDTYCSAFDARQSFKMEYRLRRFDGDYRWVLDAGVPRYLEKGTFVGYIGSAFDISDLKRGEEALRELPKSILHAQEAERRRVARELHDGVNQLLASIRFRVQSIEERLVLEQSESRHDATKAKELLENALQQVRRISQNLRPSELDDLGLIPAIRSACDEFSERTGIVARLQHSRWERLPSEIELTLYRILQEALSNVEKHAEASQVNVQLKRKGLAVHLSISDNGKGLSTSSNKARTTRRSGLGLVHMRERAAFASGKLTVRSAENKGTEIIVQIPLAHEQSRVEAL